MEKQQKLQRSNEVSEEHQDEEKDGDEMDVADEGDEDDVESQSCHEEVPVKVAKDPGLPTPEERDRHNMTHNPYRSWCPVCVEARGKEDPHRKQKKKKKDDDEVPEVGLDYKAFGQETAEDDKVILIVARDKHTLMTFAHLCRCKGAGDSWIVEKLIEDLATLGHSKLFVKTDGEPALVKVMEAIQAGRDHPTLPKHPPAYDPQANGVVEKAVDDVMAQLRALKIGLERRLKRKILSTEPILQWMIEHASMLINRCQKGHDGKTPERRLKGKETDQSFIEMGEQVMAKPRRSPTSRKKLSLRSKWVHGTWVGMTMKSHEHLVILPGGGKAIKVRTVKRKPYDDRWSSDAIAEVRATPRVPDPTDKTQRGVKSQEDPMKVIVEGEGKDLPQTLTEEVEAKTRDFKITKNLLEKHGYTDTCLGCDQAKSGKRVTSHSKDCRARIEGALQEDEEGKVRLRNRDARKSMKREEAVTEAAKTVVEDKDGQRLPRQEEDADEHNKKSESSEDDHDTSDEEEPNDTARKKKRSEADLEQNKKRRINAMAMARRVSSQLPRLGAARRIMKLEHMAVTLNKEEKKMRSKDHPKGRIVDVSEVMKDLMNLEMPNPHETEEEEQQRYRDLYEGMEFIDDVHAGNTLDKEKVMKARRLEIEFFQKMKVYEKVPRWKAQGKKVITTRWIDTTKVMRASQIIDPGWWAEKSRRINALTSLPPPHL